jgi:hypothetical protein
VVVVWWGAASCWVLREQPCAPWGVGGCCLGGPCRLITSGPVVSWPVGWGGVGLLVVGGGGVCVLFEICIVDASIFVCGQVAEGRRWMPWHQEPMKDVGGRDRPGGAVNLAVIPGCPNGETRHQLCGVTRT